MKTELRSQRRRNIQRNTLRRSHGPHSSDQIHKLTEEYFHTQKVVEDFDSKSLTIKAWSVTLSMAGIGTAYLQSHSEIIVLSAISAVLFWMIEALWKTFQYAYYERIWTIENYFSGKEINIAPLQISTSWSNSWHKGRFRRFARQATWPHVFLPHGVVFFGGVLLYFICPPR